MKTVMNQNSSVQGRIPPENMSHYINGGSKPYIANQMLTCSDGTKHNLTWLEQFHLRLGFTNVYKLSNEHNKEPQRG